MKSLKAAAVVAGSLIVAGAATPAVAQSSTPVASYNLDGAVNTTTEGTRDAKGPLGTMSLKVDSDKVLDTESKGSVLHTVKDTTNTLNDRKPLLGGLPLQD
ncbi:hypothetical protein [Streptomyces thermoalcalitolerans]|uniref:Secreted protein n=1 Tax=Streptomyces thermoalcalitolerans TaxID=65605 RepID=A0ABP3ZKN8_9ACTN